MCSPYFCTLDFLGSGSRYVLSYVPCLMFFFFFVLLLTSAFGFGFQMSEKVGWIGFTRAEKRALVDLVVVRGGRLHWLWKVESMRMGMMRAGGGIVDHRQWVVDMGTSR